VQSARDNRALACNFGKYSPTNVTSWAVYVGGVRVQRVFARCRVPRSVQLTVDLQVRTAANQQLKKEKKTKKLKTDVLRSIGKQSGESVESVVKKKARLRWEGFGERQEM